MARVLQLCGSVTYLYPIHLYDTTLAYWANDCLTVTAKEGDYFSNGGPQMFSFLMRFCTVMFPQQLPGKLGLELILNLANLKGSELLAFSCAS